MIDEEIEAKALQNLRRQLDEAEVDSAELAKEKRRAGRERRKNGGTFDVETGGTGGSLFADCADPIEKAIPRLRAAYWAELGEAPICGPGELMEAKAFHRKIVLALEKGGWDHSEHSGLSRLEKRWRKRANGEDVRFIIHGNRPGRLNRGIEQRLKMISDGEIEE